MFLRKFKQTTINWFGGLDVYCINYMIYISGGFWSLDTAKRKNLKSAKKWYWCFQIYVSMLYIVIFAGFAADAYLQWPNVEKVLYGLTSSTFFVGGVCHMMFLNSTQLEIEECFKLLSNNFYLEFVGKSKSDCDIIEEGNLEMRKTSKLFFQFFVVGVAARIVCNLAPTEKTLIVPFPFVDHLESPYYDILFWIQAMALIHFAYVVIAAEMVIYGFFIRIRKQFEIITKNIAEIEKIYFEKEDATPVEKLIISKTNSIEIIKQRIDLIFGRKIPYFTWRRETTTKKLKEVIIHHQNILGLVKRLNHAFQNDLFLQLIGGGLLLATLILDTFWKSKQLSMKMISQTTLAAPLIINTTILCTYGTQVEMKNRAAAEGVYRMPWYLMDYTNRKMASCFLMGLQHNATIKAGGMLPINRTTYLKFIKMIYNLVAFMQNAANREN